jgi:hypothetical protein
LRNGDRSVQDLGPRYKRNEHFVYRKIEEETILVPIRDNVGDMACIYKLNEVGALIWENLDGEKTLQDIKDRIAEAFEVSDREAETDLNHFMDQLKEIEAIIL